MKYERVVQEKYCCVAACLEMIFQAQDLALDQVDIACDLGLIVPEQDLQSFPNAKTGDRPPERGWGTQIEKEEFSVWEYLKTNDIPLSLKFYSARDVVPSDVKDWISADKHVMVLFNYPKLYGLEGSWGHANLVSDVDGEDVQLVDPSGKDSSNHVVKTTDLINAMESKSDLGWGFWVFSKI